MNTPYVTTKEAMEFCRISGYAKFKSILKKNKINPLWRGGDGNVYRTEDLLNIKGEREEKDAFSEF